MKKGIIALLICFIVVSFKIAISQSMAPSILNSWGGSVTCTGNTYDYNFRAFTAANTTTVPNLL